MQQSGGIPKQEWKPSLQPWSLLIHLRRPAGVCHSSSVTKKKTKFEDYVWRREEVLLMQAV